MEKLKAFKRFDTRKQRRCTSKCGAFRGAPKLSVLDVVKKRAQAAQNANITSSHLAALSAGKGI